MSKAKSSKLDPFASTLVNMELEKKTLVEMLAWLKEEGVTVGTGTLSDYLSALRSERRQMAVLKLIATGSQQHKEVKAAFAKNPAPHLEELIGLHRMLSFQLATQAVDNPELVKVADQLTRTVMEYVSAQTKAEIEKAKISQGERKLVLLEKKAAAFDQIKALRDVKAEMNDADRKAIVAKVDEILGLK